MRPEIRLVVSIDVEEDNWRPTRDGLSVENIRELPRLAAFFQRLRARATYLTAYQVALRPVAVDILRDIAGAGDAEIGAHLHAWNTPPLAEPQHESMLHNYPAAVQLPKVRSITEKLDAVFGHRPTSFRAGRFALNGATVAALAQCGYEVDTSVTPFLSWAQCDNGQDFVGAPVAPYLLNGGEDVRVPARSGELVELPLTAGYTRLQPARWMDLNRVFGSSAFRTLHLPGVAARLGLVRRVILSPESTSVRDMLALSRRVLEGGSSYLQLFLHSTSLRPGLNLFSRSRRDVDRLYATLERYIEELSSIASVTFMTVTEAATALGLRDQLARSPRAAPMVRAPAQPASAHAAAQSLTPSAGRRLLVISYHHPSSGSVGGLRWAGLSKYLVRLGWEVHYLTGFVGTPAGLKDGVQVHVCPRYRSTNDLYNALARRIRSARSTNGGGTTDDGAQARSNGPSLLGRVRIELANALILPDAITRGWILRAAANARSLVRQFQPDVVVSSGPPHSAHLVALLATRGSSVRWLIDLRDPWAGPIATAWQSHPVYRSLLFRAVMPRLERLAFGAADGVIANTSQLGEALKAQYPKVDIVWIRNGVDPESLPSSTAQPYPGLSIVYAGTLYGSHDLGPVLQAFRAFLQRHPDACQDGSKLRVAGHADGSSAIALEAQIHSLGLEPHVERLGPLPRSRALEVVSRSRLAVVLSQELELQVPSKLYETVAMGIPTLVLAEPGSAAAVEAQRLGVVAPDPGDVAGIARLLEQVWRNEVSRPSAGRATILHGQIAAILDQLFTGEFSRDHWPIDPTAGGV